jgi:hypothetical protein
MEYRLGGRGGKGERCIRADKPHLWIELAGRSHVSKSLVFITKHLMGLTTPEERLDIVGRKLQRLVTGLASFIPVLLCHGKRLWSGETMREGTSYNL